MIQYLDEISSLKKVKPGVLFAGRQLLSIAAEVYLPYRDREQRRRGNFGSDANTEFCTLKKGEEVIKCLATG